MTDLLIKNINQKLLFENMIISPKNSPKPNQTQDHRESLPSAENLFSLGVLNDVGSYSANPWGFYDMYGNVSEWCMDHVIRGASFKNNSLASRSAVRFTANISKRYINVGFRVVLKER